MSLCKWKLPFSIRLPSILPKLPRVKLPVIRLSIPSLGINITVTIKLPIPKLSLPVIKLPVLRISIPSLGINITVKIRLPSLSLKIPGLKLRFILLPRCPLDLIED